MHLDLRTLAATGFDGADQVARIFGLIGGVMLLLGLVFFGLGRWRTATTKSWVRTQGMVTTRRGELTETFASRYPTFQWYDAAGRRHQHTSNVGQSLGPRAGTRVWVRYDPDDPARGMIDGFVQGGGIFVVIGGVLLAIGVAVLVVALVVWLRLG